MSLADKIGDILNAAPATIDPEDDTHDDTKAKTVQHSQDDNDVNTEFVGTPLVQKRIRAPLLIDDDERYAGKRISRKRLASSDDEDEDEAFGSDLDEEG